MIRALVDFALKNRWMMLGGVVLLTIWGVLSFRSLPVEAYPDVADNYVQIITQWPGRSAEEIERQVTVPVEIQMAGIPHLAHLRSTTLAGLSSVMLIFDESGPADGHRLESRRPNLLVHTGEHQPRLRRDGKEVA
jgi:cobalt-zinc-cadmium resistance protein CzcA